MDRPLLSTSSGWRCGYLGDGQPRRRLDHRRGHHRHLGRGRGAQWLAECPRGRDGSTSCRPCLDRPSRCGSRCSSRCAILGGVGASRAVVDGFFRDAALTMPHHGHDGVPAVDGRLGDQVGRRLGAQLGRPTRTARRLADAVGGAGCCTGRRWVFRIWSSSCAGPRCGEFAFEDSAAVALRGAVFAAPHGRGSACSPTRAWAAPPGILLGHQLRQPVGHRRRRAGRGGSRAGPVAWVLVGHPAVPGVAVGAETAGARPAVVPIWALAARHELSASLRSAGSCSSPLFFSEVLILTGGFLGGRGSATAAALLGVGSLGLAGVLVEGTPSRGRTDISTRSSAAPDGRRAWASPWPCCALLAVAAPFLPGMHPADLLSAGLP